MTAAVALIDYGSGNLRSAEKALTRAAAESGAGHEIVVTADPSRVAAAERVVLPGVGAFGPVCLQPFKNRLQIRGFFDKACERRDLTI